LTELAAITGAYTQGRLFELSKKYPKFISKTRGIGTFISFSCETAAHRDKLALQMKTHGVQQGGNGDRSMRMRPTLYFEKKHADIYCDALERACKDLS